MADVVVELGPNAMFMGMTLAMFGEMVGVIAMQKLEARAKNAGFIRAAMATNPHLQTYREHGNHSLCDTFTSCEDRPCRHMSC